MILCFQPYLLVDDSCLGHWGRGRVLMECVGNRIELFMGFYLYGVAFASVLIGRAAGVLTKAPLPAPGRIAGLHPHPGVGGIRCVTEGLCVMAACQVVARRQSYAVQFVRELHKRRVRFDIGQPDQDAYRTDTCEQSTLNQSVVRTLNAIVAPLPGEPISTGRWQASMVFQQIEDLVFPQPVPRQGVRVGVLAFVRDVQPEMIGQYVLDCARALRGRPTLGQEVLDQVEEHGGCGQLGLFQPLGASASASQLGAAGVRGCRAIGHRCRLTRRGSKTCHFDVVMVEAKRRSVKALFCDV